MSVDTKTLTINSNNLGVNAALLLIFDVGNGSHVAYRDFYPVVLRVAHFGATGRYATTFRYINQLSFVKPEEGLGGKRPDGGEDDEDDGGGGGDGLDKGIESVAATWVDIDPGHKTTLTLDGVVYQFSTPTPISKPEIQAWNESSLRQDIAVGYQKKKDTLPQSAWLFPKVGSGFDVTTEFTPILRAYVTNGYEEDQVVKTVIPSLPIWTQDLRVLTATTNWMLTWNAATGKYSINELTF